MENDRQSPIGVKSGAGRGQLECGDHQCASMLSLAEALMLMRLRWQIGLVFKL
jgi:hypothetical protein